jgi:hypothetical protein
VRIRLPAVAVHGAERTFAETLMSAKCQAFPLSSRAVLCFFHVRCSAYRSGDPIVAEKRPDYYAINYPELQARIENGLYVDAAPTIASPEAASTTALE